MRMFLILCFVTASLSDFSAPVRAAGDSTPITVVIRANSETKYSEVVNVIDALRENRVGRVQLEMTEPQSSEMSAIILAGSDTSFKTVAAVLEALQKAGLRKVRLDSRR